jgi:hypothetical protein
MLELYAADLAALVRLGWLSRTDCDQEALVEGFCGFVDRGTRVARNTPSAPESPQRAKAPAALSQGVVGVFPPTIERLSRSHGCSARLAHHLLEERPERVALLGG